MMHFRLVAAALILALSLSGRSHAQPLPGAGAIPAELEQNKKLRVQLDRTAIRAFEPIYLCLTAQQFAAGHEVEVRIQRNDEAVQTIPLLKNHWVASEIPGTGSPGTQRMGIILQSVMPVNASQKLPRQYLFPASGEYKILVKIGPDTTTLKLNVADPPADVKEQEAWEAISDSMDAVLNNDFDLEPTQAHLDNCARIVRRYPKTVCAAYCQSYLSIAKFKVLFAKYARQGTKATYGDAADELSKVAAGFHESFFGEMMAFYACYAKGLCRDFEDLLKTASAMKSHHTPWADAVDSMKGEVLKHLTSPPPTPPVEPTEDKPADAKPADVKPAPKP